MEIWPTQNRVYIAIVLTILTFTTPASGADSVRRLVFGVLPSLVPEKLIPLYEPLVDYIASRSELPIRIETAPDYREFVRRTHEEQRYDFVLVSPHLAYLAHQIARYTPLVRADAEPLRAVVVVRTASDIRRVSDLKGTQLAIPDELSVVTVMTRAILARENIGFRRNVDVVMTPTVDAALQLLLNGRVDGAALSSTFLTGRMLGSMREQIRIIVESDEVPQMTINIAPWVDRQVGDHVRSVLLAMHESIEGSIVLRKMGAKGYVMAAVKDYDGMRHVMRYLEY